MAGAVGRVTTAGSWVSQDAADEQEEKGDGLV